MNCQRFEQVVSDLARGQMMEADVRAEALAHSEECEHCAMRSRDEEKLTRGLQFLAAGMESIEAPDGVELKLREAFRRRHEVVPVAVNSSRSRYWLVAVAAMLLVVMGVVGMWLSSNSPEKNVAENPSPKQVETPAGQSNLSGPKEPEPQKAQEQAENRLPKRQIPKPTRRTTRKAPETQMANHASNEIATDFMPLGDANALVLQDGGQIIRVKVPRSTLVRFGFPVNMDRYNENVKADVIVGVDGLARAIRFVQ
jgi:hypothetical protein